MKKTTKKSASKAFHQKAKNLDVKPAKGGTVRGGNGKHYLTGEKPL
jgi:hypothetical protein